MSSKSSRAVLRAVVLPALGLTSADLLLSACDRSAQQSTIEQRSRQVAVPGMVSTETTPQPQVPTDSGVPAEDSGVLEAREIPVSGTIAPRPQSEDGPGVVRPPPGPPPIRRPPPGPPMRRPRPGPPGRAVTDSITQKSADLESKPEVRTERRGRTPTDSGSLPGIAGARARRATR